MSQLKKAKHKFKTVPDEVKHSLFELVGDLKAKEFNALIKPYLGIEKKGKRIIELRNEMDRTLLNEAAYRGNYEVVLLLLQLHNDHKVSIYSEDVNGNNALELACIRGYNNHPKELVHVDTKKVNISKRYMTAKVLLDSKTNVIPGKNPAHTHTTCCGSSKKIQHSSKIFDFCRSNLKKR